MSGFSGLQRNYLKIQPCGCLLVLTGSMDRIVLCSANAEYFLQRPAESLLECSPELILGARVLGRIRRELAREDALSGPVSIRPESKGRNLRLQVNAFRSGGWVIVEIEPITGLGSRRLTGTVSRWLAKLATAANPDELMKILVDGVRDLVRFDRVVVAHFDEQGHGVFLAESKRKGVSPIRGQRFSATAYPPAQRDNMTRHQVRSIPDVHAGLVPVLVSDRLTKEQLADIDASGTVLRAPSRRQTAYLKYFRAQALLSIAIVGPGGLWGLVTCTAQKPIPLAPTLRDGARTLVLMATQRLFLLRSRMEAQFLQRVHRSRDFLAADITLGLSPARMLEKYAPDWLALFRAQGMAYANNGDISALGEVPPVAALEQMVARLNAEKGRSPWVSCRLDEESLVKDLDLGTACGMLAVPLPGERVTSWLLIFRPQQGRGVYWEGRPEADILTSAPGEEETFRRAFGSWLQAVEGSSETWKRVERIAAVDLAEDLALLASISEITRLNELLKAEQAALAQANEQLSHAASHDSLTALWNRYRTEEELDRELAKSRRHGLPFSVLLLDVDHFKQINDSWGHAAGDEVLREVARRVTSVLRQGDHLGRWGGEEFVILANGADRRDGVILAERIRHTVSEVAVPGVETSITASIGVATWRPEDKRKTIVQRADRAMYAAKKSGRNRVETDEGL
ncbi:diguanylate cyclase [Marinobacter pelagius]|uniref:sensor domain-containing diguanylate cyclase n=1 Tax=Marinobacter sp. C7 TaxID=2951363 RepID=UPI001EEFB195|nr:sensor domain-containing diguanylate cyclase [Marinobacter sp. C7]MCG7199758.1 diguanylate cyclase [Marinobacter sp. C7]